MVLLKLYAFKRYIFLFVFFGEAALLADKRNLYFSILLISRGAVGLYTATVTPHSNH